MKKRTTLKALKAINSGLLNICELLLDIAHQDYTAPRERPGDNFECEPWVQSARRVISEAKDMIL